MLLAVDIGNTTVSLGVLKERRVIRVSSLDARVAPMRLRSQLKRALAGIRRRFPDIREVVLCSVVPEVLAIVERLVVRHLGIRPAIVGRDIKVPLKNNYHNPKQVGQDRLVCAYAAKCLYGWPVIVIDFGTAVTLDVISRRGDYEGGMIVPGIRLSAEALFQKTALLPRISVIKGPHALIGKDTRESILSGIFFGYGAMCDGLIVHISRKLREKPKVVVTGGYIHLMKRFMSTRGIKVERDLVFKGMGLLVCPPAEKS